MVVLGFGKLGGNELNFSSDIDLVLAYASAGQTDGARPLDNNEYFIREARQRSPRSVPAGDPARVLS